VTVPKFAAWEFLKIPVLSGDADAFTRYAKYWLTSQSTANSKDLTWFFIDLSYFFIIFWKNLYNLCAKKRKKVGIINLIAYFSDFFMQLIAHFENIWVILCNFWVFFTLFSWKLRENLEKHFYIVPRETWAKSVIMLNYNIARQNMQRNKIKSRAYWYTIWTVYRENKNMLDKRKNSRGAAFTITQNSLETARQAGKSSLFGSYNGQATGQRVTQAVTTATRCIPLVDFVFER
jgi:hypothetical protein